MASLYNRDFAPSVVLWTTSPELFWKGTTKRGKGNTSEVGSPLKMKPCYLSQHVCKHTLSSWGCDNIKDLSWLFDGVLPNQTHYYEKCLNRTGWCCQHNGQTRRTIFEVLAECRKVLNWKLGTCANLEFLSQSETLPRLITMNTWILIRVANPSEVIFKL